eukprot:6019389-Pleurochrysis_carterae.AAC.2
MRRKRVKSCGKEARLKKERMAKGDRQGGQRRQDVSDGPVDRKGKYAGQGMKARVRTDWEEGREEWEMKQGGRNEASR